MSVEDIGMKLHDTLQATLFRTVDVVMFVAIRREGIGHLQTTLADGDAERCGINGFALLHDT